MDDLVLVTYFLAFLSILFSGLSILLGYKYRLLLKKKTPKITDSEAFTQFFRDATTRGGGVIEVTYINQDDMYFHRRQ